MSYIDVVFDGPPAPVSGRFIEVEDENGTSIKVGEWVKRDDGYWVLRIPQEAPRSQSTVILEPGSIIVANADGREAAKEIIDRISESLVKLRSGS